MKVVQIKPRVFLLSCVIVVVGVLPVRILSQRARARADTPESEAAAKTHPLRYKTAAVDGLEIFYREAGPRSGPTIVLLHGFPTSSHMFRNLIPALSDRFHVVAPDYPGFGYSSMPPVDKSLLDRPGNNEIQLQLFYDYRSNPPLYPQWQAYFRKHQPPMLIVWGKNDPIFPAEGAYPYRRDLKHVEFHLLDTGHFALEEDGPIIAGLIRQFLDKNVISRGVDVP